MSVEPRLPAFYTSLDAPFNRAYQPRGSENPRRNEILKCILQAVRPLTAFGRVRRRPFRR